MIDRVSAVNCASRALNWPAWKSAETSGKRADRQRERGGQAQQHRQLGRLALDARRLVGLADADVAADLRQDGGAERRADHAERQLVQAVGIVELADRAGADAGQEEGVDEHADLIDAGAERRRDDDADELADAGRQPRLAQLEDDPARLQATSSSPSWSTPPTVTAIGERRRGDCAAARGRRSARDSIARLSRAGAKAAAVKRASC